ncbi:MAG: hypothetical protein AB8A39_05800, partial [Prochlorococcus sp.]
MAAAAPIRLTDYTPYPFRVPSISLDVVVEDDHARVISRLQVEPLSSSTTTGSTASSCSSSEALVLQGVDLN